MKIKSLNLSGGGIGTMLTITFVVMKCLGYIDWAWWIVFAPLWGAIALGLIVFVIVLAVAIIVVVLQD